MNDDTLNRFSRLVKPSFLNNSAHQISEMMASYQAVIEKASAATLRFSSAHQIAEMMASHQAVIEKAAVATLRFSSAHQIAEMMAPKSFYRFAGLVAQSEPEWLLELTNQVSNINIVDINTESFGDDLEALVDRLDSIEDEKNFLSEFSKLNPIVKIFLCFFLCQLLTPIVASITAGLLTPKVESYLESSKAPDREKIREIKQITLPLSEINTNNLRFIKGNNVRLRTLPSTKSEILDKFAFGQVVTVLSKRRNWIQVMYEHENGEIQSGWVFTRYTARFVK